MNRLHVSPLNNNHYIRSNRMSPRKRKGPPKAQSPKAVIRTQNAEKETFGSQGTSMDSLETEVTAAITNEAEGGLGSTEDVSVVLLAQESSQKKWRNWWIRTLWTFLMISGFVCILLAGHLWVILLVMAIVTLIYREVISIGIAPVKALQVLPWYTFLHWYFYAVTVYYLYIETLAYYCKPTPFVERFLMPAAIHHRFISFLLYMAGFILFVVNLKKGHYRFQFSQYALLAFVYENHDH